MSRLVELAPSKGGGPVLNCHLCKRVAWASWHQLCPQCYAGAVGLFVSVPKAHGVRVTAAPAGDRPGR